MKKIIIYTDASFHPQKKIGSWVFIILSEDQIIKTGLAHNTSQHRMELQAVIESILYGKKHFNELQKLIINTDSQYVYDLQIRKEKIFKNNFLTKSEKDIRNKDLVEIFFELNPPFEFEIKKVQSHEKEIPGQTNYNRMADKLSRKIVRDYLKSNR